MSDTANTWPGMKNAIDKTFAPAARAFQKSKGKPMNKSLTFSCTALVGTSKEGVIRPDENGYYHVVLGALDVENSAGALYPYDAAKELFKQDSALMRRITDGACRAEYGHPKREPGMTNRDFLQRIITIEETRVCAHIKEVTLDFDNFKGKTGENIIVILGKVKPSGPYADALKNSLENPGENVCFSIRSLTQDAVVGGRVVKNLRSIITWDYVNEPGIHLAKKWNSPSMESIDDSGEAEETISTESIREVAKMERETGVSMESSSLTAQQLLSDLGVESIDPTMKPAPSLEW